MVEHLVLMKWKEGVSPSEIDAAFAGLRALKDRIPGVIVITCGANFSERARGFHAGLYVRFVDKAALEAYLPHPAHQEVVNALLLPIREDVIALDYEI